MINTEAHKNHEIPIRSLTQRADFLRLRHASNIQGYVASRRGFLLQAAPNMLSDEILRYGLTVTKKMGNAVIRNRIKRRLRHAIKAIAPLYGRIGYDYVLVARQGALTMPYNKMLDDLQEAFVLPEKKKLIG